MLADPGWASALQSLPASCFFLRRSPPVGFVVSLASGAGMLVAVAAFGVQLRIWASVDIAAVLASVACLLVATVDLQAVEEASIDSV